MKTLNTVTAAIMVDPRGVADGDHHVFVSGNDAGAKDTVMGILKEFGWIRVLDLGDITTARGAEMYLPIWLRMGGGARNRDVQRTDHEVRSRRWNTRRC